jgi:pimeloyl-ACP methyl ester carboxylesterase
VPTLVVTGAEEILRKVLDPDLARSKADDIRFELVHGSGHWLMEEAPERVNELLLEFLA